MSGVRRSSRCIRLVIGAASWCVSCGGEDIQLGRSVPTTEGAGASAAAGGSSALVPPSPRGRPVLTVMQVEPIRELNTELKEDNVTLTGDQLELCFTSQRPGGTGDVDVHCAIRGSLNEPFSSPAEAVPVNSPAFETSASLSLDGLSLWVGSERPGGLGGLDVWRADRSERSLAWQPPIAEISLNSPDDDIPRPPGAKGRTMPLGSRRGGALYGTYLADRAPDGSFSEPLLIEELAQDGRVVVDGFLSEDGRLLIYVLATEVAGSDIFYSTRMTLEDPFSEPSALDGVNSPFDDRDPWLSPDGSAFYFVSDRDGTFDIFRAQATLSD